MNVSAPPFPPGLDRLARAVDTAASLRIRLRALEKIVGPLTIVGAAAIPPAIVSAFEARADALAVGRVATHE